MAKKKQSKKVEEKKLQKGIKEVKILFDAYVDKVSDILSPWDVNEEALDELIVQDENFRNELDAMTEIPEDFDLCMEKLEAMDYEDIDCERLLDLVSGGDSAYIDNSITDYLYKKGFAIIKIGSLENERKISAFCKELYPCVNEECNYNV